MATIANVRQIKPTVVNKFLGININETGDTQIKLGESGNMTNYYITDDYKLKKMYGYKSIYNFESDIQGIYGTTVKNNSYLLVATDSKLYYFLQSDLDNEQTAEIEPTFIGDINEKEVSFFEFNDCVYIIGGGYWKWDGEYFGEVEGYVPLLFISSNPAGGGIIYDELNMLTSKKHQTFNGDGESKEFHLAQKEIENVYKVLVNDEEIQDYTVNNTNGVVTFQTAPTKAMNNVDIYWEKDDGDRHIIENMRYGTIFGGNTDSRVFLYGNQECKNRTYFSGNEDGIPSVEYFAAAYQVDIGPSNNALTDLTRQYDRLLATTNRPEAYFLTISLEELEVNINGVDKTKRYVPSVTTHPLNEAHGNMAYAQGQVLNNYPITIDKSGLALWKATNVRDEKNIEIISERIQHDLNDMPATGIKTVEIQDENSMWFGQGNTLFIYNYGNNTFSRLKITNELKEFTELNKTTYMSTKDNKIMKWSKDYSTFDGEIIKAHWEMNFEDFNGFYSRKTMRKLWVQMQPSMKASAEIGYITNLMESATRKKISYEVNAGFDNVDFNNYNFKLSINPQPFRLKIKAKKFTNLKITIDNSEETNCVITGIALKVQEFGESK